MTDKVRCCLTFCCSLAQTLTSLPLLYSHTHFFLLLKHPSFMFILHLWFPLPRKALSQIPRALLTGFIQLSLHSNISDSHLTLPQSYFPKTLIHPYLLQVFLSGAFVLIHFIQIFLLPGKKIDSKMMYVCFIYFLTPSAQSSVQHMVNNFFTSVNA